MSSDNSGSSSAMNGEPSMANNHVIANGHVTEPKLAKPLHLQQLEKALSVDLLIRQVESLLGSKR